MMQGSYLENSYAHPERLGGITPEEYRLLHHLNTKAKVCWRFKPKSVWPFVMWGLALFVLFRILLWPLTEGVFNYLSNARELHKLKIQYQLSGKDLAALQKTRDYMLTPSFIEEKGHQLGMVKANEVQMVVAQPNFDGFGDLTAKKKKRVEIGD